MIRLVLPSIQYKKSYIMGIREFQQSGLLNDIDINELVQNFELYINEIRLREQGIGQPEGYSPQTEYWLVDDDRYIGTIRIRHELNDVLLRTEGNVGYHIRPSERKKGYGKKILTMALPLIIDMNMKKILVTCDEDNIGSRKIIEANGGILENIVDKGEGTRRMRFWITL